MCFVHARLRSVHANARPWMKRFRRRSTVFGFAKSNAALRSTEAGFSGTQRRVRGTGARVGRDASARARNVHASSMGVKPRSANRRLPLRSDDLGSAERNVAFKEP